MLSSQQNMGLPSAVWLAAVLVFIGLEGVVIFSQLSRYLYSPWSFHFFYLPIMLTLPLSTGWPLYVKLKNGPELVDPNFAARISSALALLTLVSYMTVLIGVAELL